MTKFDLAEAIEALRKNEDKTFVMAEEGSDFTDATNRISFHQYPKENTESFAMKLEKGSEVDLEHLLLAAATLGLTFSYKYDSLKSLWQSMELVNQYQSMGRPYAHLKQYEVPGQPRVLAQRIDISDNPGRQRLTYTMKIMAAPEMWFGPGCWPYFDKQRVASFPEAKAVKWLSDDILYVKLFEWDVPDYEAADVLSLQRRFREWVGMDAIEAALQEKIGIQPI